VLAALLGAGLVPSGAWAAESAAAEPTAAEPTSAGATAAADFTDLVNTFVSTEDDFGQDLPGAEAPNSVVKINPMTTTARSHSGYDYAEDQIAGFTHTNLDGVGGSGGGGDLLVVPTYVTYTNRPSTGSYAKTYSHATEEAEPGYYGVSLATTTGADGSVTDAAGVAPIRAEATTDVRTGQDRFTFPRAGRASLVVDLRNNFTNRRGATLDVETLADGRAALSGDFSGHFNGYDYQMHYYVETTAAVAGVRTWGGAGALGATAHRDGTDIGAILDFDVTAGQQVGLKVAVSPISVEQARIDLGVEMADRTFQQVRDDTSAAWEEILGRLAVTASATSDPDGELQELFYTHLYRLFGMPMNATSTSGTYRGLDGKVHEADGYTHYDGWALWDDFRKYEILAIGYPEVFRDIAQSLVDLYATFADSGRSSLAGAVHSVPTVRFERAAVVVADAVAKGASLRHLGDAWPALVSQSQGGYGNADNVKRGYVANEVDDTLGTAYDDWAMATIADSLGRTEEAASYRLRAANWTNLFKRDAVTLADGTKTGLVFPKGANGTWLNANPEQFEAGNVYQGTLWQYNWYAADDMGGMIQLMGGEETARGALSFMFGEHAPEDGTRMLHSNANEIDLQAPYLFNYVGAPAKTQHWVRSIYTKETWNRYLATGSTNEAPSGGGEFTPPVRTKVFKNEPQGFLPTMDNDAGTMSSTFVAAALGLFPVLAGSDEYQIGTPFFEDVRISYESGRTFDISANGVSPDDYYIQSATLNGQPLDRTWLTYDQLTAGGHLSFDMGDQASDWAADGVAPSSLSDRIPSSVYDPTSAIAVDSRAFTESDAGDGSIGNSIALTLANGTFAGANGDDLAATGGLTAANLPAGLTLVARRETDRRVRLTLAGRAEASGSLDSIDDLGLQIADAAFNRQPSTGSREFALKVTYAGVAVRAASTALVAAPDGTVDVSVPLTLSGASWAGADGRDLVAAGHLALPGLPAGVQARATKRDAVTLDLHLTGSLGDSERVEFSLAFTDGALLGVPASSLGGDGVSGLATLTLTVDQQRRAHLVALLEEADLVVRGAYSLSSFSAFAAARDEARALLAEAGATDDDLRAAQRDLATAGAALRIGAAPDRVVLDGTTFDQVAFDDDFSTDRMADYTVFADTTEAGAALSVDTTAGVLKGTADGRRWSHVALPVSGGERFALVVEPSSFAGTGAAEDSLFLGLTDGPTSRAHSWFNNTRSESGFDVVVDGQGRDLGAGSLTGVQWNPGDRFATVVDDGVITSWIEEDGAWRRIRSGQLSTALTPAQIAAWDPTLSLRLDPGTIAIDRVTLLTSDDTDEVAPVRVQAEDFTSSSGGTLVKEGTSPSGNVGGTYDGGQLAYDAVDFGSGSLTSVTVRASTRDERVGANRRLEFYLDEPTPANLVGTVALPLTGGWANYVTTTADLTTPVTGTHRLVVVMHTDPVAGQGYNYVANLDWFELAPVVEEVPPADTAALEAAVAAAEGLLVHEERFPSFDVAVLHAALDAASEVVGSAAATQDEVDEAQRVLDLAAGQLVWKVVRQLPALVTEAEAIDTAPYSDESVAALSAALAQAKAVPADASYETYAAALAGLRAAVAGLVEPAPDTVAPTLVVPAAGTVALGAAFDPLAGVSATDDVDGDLTSAITVAGTVDTSRPGSSTLTYRVVDAAGNEATKQRVVVVAAATLTTGTPAIAGTPRPGGALTVQPGTWTGGTALTYQWLRDGQAIGGATGTAYQPVVGDVGRSLAVRVTGTLAGYETASVTSAPVVVVPGVLTAATPKVAGTAAVGRKLTARPGSWTPGTRLAFQWLRDGKAIKGAHRAAYRVRPTDAGHKLSVRVTGSLAGYGKVTRTSAAKAVRAKR
jgi:predicted alpha-1,2-mannosidase